jgi:hypothetical protein
METNEFNNPADRLKLQMIKRVILLVFGSIMICGLMAILAGAFFAAKTSDAAPIPNVEISAGVPEKPGQPTGDVPVKPIPIYVEEHNKFPIGALIVPLIVIGLFGLIAYGIYDLIRLRMHYRWMKERDDVMFP